MIRIKIKKDVLKQCRPKLDKLHIHKHSHVHAYKHALAYTHAHAHYLLVVRVGVLLGEEHGEVLVVFEQQLGGEAGAVVQHVRRAQVLLLCRLYNTILY